MKDKKDIEQLARIVKHLKQSIQYDEDNLENMDAASWQLKQGVILSTNEAKLLLNAYELAQQSQSASIQQAVEQLKLRLAKYNNQGSKSKASENILFAKISELSNCIKVLEKLNVSDGWIELPAKELLTSGYYAIRIEHNGFMDIKVEFIDNQIIPYHYATHYYKVVLPSPPQLKK